MTANETFNESDPDIPEILGSTQQREKSNVGEVGFLYTGSQWWSHGYSRLHEMVNPSSWLNEALAGATSSRVRIDDHGSDISVNHTMVFGPVENQEWPNDRVV